MLVVFAYGPRSHPRYEVGRCNTHTSKHTHIHTHTYTLYRHITTHNHHVHPLNPLTLLNPLSSYPMPLFPHPSDPAVLELVLCLLDIDPEMVANAEKGLDTFSLTTKRPPSSYHLTPSYLKHTYTHNPCDNIPSPSSGNPHLSLSYPATNRLHRRIKARLRGGEVQGALELRPPHQTTCHLFCLSGDRFSTNVAHPYV